MGPFETVLGQIYRYMEEGREVDGRVGKGGVREEEAEWEGEEAG